MLKKHKEPYDTAVFFAHQDYMCYPYKECEGFVISAQYCLQTGTLLYLKNIQY